jgi:MoaA/NifB/PqqE/SkfB family radical SAM enzyme
MTERRMPRPRPARRTGGRLVELFGYGADSPIRLTWELACACDASRLHCPSVSGRRDPRELSTEERKAVIDEMARMQVFYVNISGGEPAVRPDLWRSPVTAPATTWA